MEYRHLGSTGLQISALSFGSWVTFGQQVGEQAAHELMDAARQAGVNFFDNAEAYAGGKAETIMGAVIRRAGWKRSDLVISTKVFWGGSGPNDRGLSRKHVVEGVEASLARLRLDYVDLVFCHRPDPATPVEETVRAMNYLIDRGKAFYWGTSEWPATQIMNAYQVARREHLIPPVMEQPQYHMFHRERVEREYAPLYRELGLGTTTWSPLASGLLSGKYNDGVPEDSRGALENYAWLRTILTNDDAKKKIEKIRELQPIVQELGCTTAQLAIAWCVKNPDVSTVITGATRVEQLVENMAALDVAGRLDDKMTARIESVLDNRPPAEPNYRES